MEENNIEETLEVPDKINRDDPIPIEPIIK